MLSRTASQQVPSGGGNKSGDACVLIHSHTGTAIGQITLGIQKMVKAQSIFAAERPCLGLHGEAI